MNQVAECGQQPGMAARIAEDEKPDYDRSWSRMFVRCQQGLMGPLNGNMKSRKDYTSLFKMLSA